MHISPGPQLSVKLSLSLPLCLSSLFKHSTMKQILRNPSSQSVDWNVNCSVDQRPDTPANMRSYFNKVG